MPMQTITTAEDLQPLSSHPALLVLWGGAHCGVCSALKPRIADLLQQTPALAGLALTTVDCEQAPAVCAQQGVFSVPVLRLYLDGRLALDFGRHFSLSVVQDGLVRQLALQGGADPAQGGAPHSAFAASGERNREEKP